MSFADQWNELCTNYGLYDKVKEWILAADGLNATSMSDIIPLPVESLKMIPTMAKLEGGVVLQPQSRLNKLYKLLDDAEELKTAREKAARESNEADDLDSLCPDLEPMADRFCSRYKQSFPASSNRGIK